MGSLKTASYTVRVTTEQASRFNRAAQAEGYASTGAWLGAAADAYLKMRAKAGLPLPLVWSRGTVRVDLEDGSTVDLKGWRARPFGFYRGDPTGPGLKGRHAFTLVYLPDRRPLATFRYAGQCKSLASELAGPLIRGIPPPDPDEIVERYHREAT